MDCKNNHHLILTGLIDLTLVYALNVIDAIVDAHLDPIRKDPDLKIRPTVIQDDSSLGFNYKVGVGLNLKF